MTKLLCCYFCLKFTRWYYVEHVMLFFRMGDVFAAIKEKGGINKDAGLHISANNDISFDANLGDVNFCAVAAFTLVHIRAIFEGKKTGRVRYSKNK